jgi:uncharacterized protein YheU (UPF0270 family)
MKYGRLGATLEWKYGPIAGTKQVGDKMVVSSWRHETIEKPDEAQIIQDIKEYEEHLVSIAYKWKREKEYPPVGDQLDTIIKVIRGIRARGTDIGKEGDTLLDEIQRVKDKYPKPEVRS